VTLARVPPPGEISFDARRRRDLTSWRGPAAGAAAGLVLAAMAVGGYALGASGRHSDSEAAAAERAAERRAFAAAKRDLIARGERDGLRAGAAAGLTAGSAAGRRASAASASRQRAATATPTGIKDCPKTPIRGKSYVSSVRSISCAAAASEQLRALRSGHPNTTPKGFTCQRLDSHHYRCVHGAQAYRWDISP
jgi:hypothetical protein